MAIVDIAIPIAKETPQLEQCVQAVEHHTKIAYNLIVNAEPHLNVAENRQAIMDKSTARYLCFLDDDSMMIDDHWLTIMIDTIKCKPDAGAVFLKEWWGNEPLGTNFHNATTGIRELDYGPSACMLIDRSRIPDTFSWDSRIGLRSDWLGGDFEEVDWQYRLRHETGLKSYMNADKMFHHLGGKTTRDNFKGSGRWHTVMAMQALLDHKYIVAPEDEDWFKGLRYVPAAVHDDNQFAPGFSVKDCYSEVVKRNGLQHRSIFKRLGICE
jgi:hypothetical protein